MYAKVENGSVVKYPYSFLDLRKDNPSISFSKNVFSNGDDLSTYGVVEVSPVDRPYKAGWDTFQETPSFDGTQWMQNWSQSPKSVDNLGPEDITTVNPPEQEGYTAEEGEPELVDGEWRQTWNLAKNTWRENRIIAYGDVDKQIEFITENGLEAWQARVAEIKAQFPKQ